MFISRLEVRLLRNLTSVSLSPGAGINIIEGANASGKTSLLEAIHLLCLARSFRTLRTTHIVQHGQQSLSVFAEIRGEQAHQYHRLGLQRFSDNRLLMRLDGSPLHSRAELVRLLPLLLLTPESSQLLTGSPKGRRQYIDWMMFHVEPSFHPLWLDYQRVLKQRNSLLRSRQLNTLSYWDELLIEHGDAIDQLRKTTIEQLLPHLNKFFNLLLPANLAIECRYRQGWKNGLSLGEALNEALASDKRQQLTSIGPHRCDLVLTSNQRTVSEVLSRGQLKLVVIAMTLAQLELVSSCRDKQGIVLVDDLPAELDTRHRVLLIETLHRLSHQVFITTTDPAQLLPAKVPGAKVFHVEHGDIKEVVY